MSKYNDRGRQQGIGNKRQKQMQPPRGNRLKYDEGPEITELPALKKKKEFTSRCKLYVGNIPTQTTVDELQELFKPYGKTKEVWASGKGFGFLRLDTRPNAEKARDELDLSQYKNRTIRVRFAETQTILKVKELSPLVSNELLEQAFAAFGPVEFAVHLCDSKGQGLGEGIVEFERKNNAAEALRRINEGVFFLTATPHPIVAEMLEHKDDSEGVQENNVMRNPLYMKEREVPPRFAPPNSFEFDFGMKWKEIYAVEAQRRAQLEQEFKEMRANLECDMDYAYQEYQTKIMKEELRRRQEELEAMEAQQAARFAERRGFMGGANRGGSMMQQHDQSPFGQPPMGIGQFDAGFGLERGDPGQFTSMPPPQNPNIMGDVKKLMQMMNKDKQAQHGVSPMRRGGGGGNQAFMDAAQPGSSRLGSGYSDGGFGGGGHQKRKRY